MTSESIHLDIAFLIIDVISSERDYQTLSSLSQTCKRLLPYCRRILFQSMHLLRLDSRRIGELNDILMNKGNEVASFVKNFEYDTDPAHANDWRVISIIQSLSNVQRLELRFSSMRPELLSNANDPNWDEIPDILKDALSGLLSLDSLKTLVLHDIDAIPVTELWRAKNLTDLEVNPSVNFIQHSGSDFTGLRRPPRLHRFIVDDVGSWDSRKCLLGPSGIRDDHGVSLRSVDFSSLKELSIMINNPEEWDAAREIAGIGRNTLQRIEYKVDQATELEGLGEIIADTDDGMPNLKSLEFLIWVGYLAQYSDDEDEEFEDPFLSGLCEELSILEQASDKHALERIKIDIDIMYGDYLSIDPNDWRELGDIFSRPGFQNTRLMMNLPRIKELEKVFEELKEKLRLSFNYSHSGAA